MGNVIKANSSVELLAILIQTKVLSFCTTGTEAVKIEQSAIVAKEI